METLVGEGSCAGSLKISPFSTCSVKLLGSTALKAATAMHAPPCQVIEIITPFERAWVSDQPGEIACRTGLIAPNAVV